MREIGRLQNEAQAALFSDFLYARGIENQLEGEDNGESSIWVLDEEQLAAASEHLSRFRADPEQPEFAQAVLIASKKRQTEEKSLQRKRSTVITEEGMRYEQMFARLVLPIAMVVVCVAVAIASRLGAQLHPISFLFITAEGITRLPTSSGLSEILQGEVWRLITPIFIHFGVLHLLFNMMWLVDLGGIIERRFGVVYFAVMVLSVAILSNLGQFLSTHHPVFGGMSGVNYGLFGFLWMRGKYDPTSGVELNKTTVQLMIIWYFLCLSQLMGPVANTAHTIGLLVGVIWGLITARHFPLPRFLRK